MGRVSERATRVVRSTRRRPEGAGDRGQHLRAGLLEPALDLGEVLHRDARLLGHVGQGALGGLALGPELVTHGLAPQRLRLGRGLGRWLDRECDDVTHDPTIGRVCHSAAACSRRANASVARLLRADDPHREELRAAAVGVAERAAGAVDLVLAGRAAHLQRRLGEAEHAGGADRVGARARRRTC